MFTERAQTPFFLKLMQTKSCSKACIHEGCKVQFLVKPFLSFNTLIFTMTFVLKRVWMGLDRVLFFYFDFIFLLMFVHFNQEFSE